MRQRLGIAQAILHNPKVLILDEPMNGLDPIGIKELKDLLVKLAKELKIAIIISSHILSELESICNRVCIISKGKMIKDETMDNIKKITNIIKTLILNDILILEMKKENISLENIFLEMERNNKNA